MALVRNVLACLGFGLIIRSALAQTVTVTLYSQRVLGGSPCSAPPAFQCAGLGPDQCCSNGAVNQYFGALFNGLHTAGVPAQGVVYTVAGGNACGTSCNAGYGQALCLSCGSTRFSGAEWLYVSSKKRSPDDCALANIAFVDGRKFRINYDVPADVTDTLSALAIAQNTTYAELSPDLLQYEIKENDDDSSVNGGGV